MPLFWMFAVMAAVSRGVLAGLADPAPAGPAPADRSNVVDLAEARRRRRAA